MRFNPWAGSVLVMLLLAAWPQALSQGCGLPNPNRFQGYTFIQPFFVNPNAGAAPFFLDFASLYEQYGRQEKRQVEDNIDEWYERFCESATLEDIYWVVYKSTLYDMEEIRTAIGAKRSYLSAYLSKNTFARHLVRNKCEETANYLAFAKRCEPYVLEASPWGAPNTNLQAMDDLIRYGRQIFLTVESHYIRLRYAYQLIRLAHYSRQYQLVLELYDYLMPKIDHDPSIIQYWIEGHYAGALQALGRNVDAAYYYARVFQHCPSKRESAFRSFKVKNDEEWNQLFLRCVDDKERTTLYAMRAQIRDSRALEEMQNIYALDPRSDYLETMIVAEVKKIEKNLLGLEFNDHRETNLRYSKIPQPGIGDYVIELQAFARKVADDGKAPHLDIWRISEGYLQLLAGDYYAAGKTLGQAADLVDSKALQEQLRIFQLVLEIAELRFVNPPIEDRIAGIRLDEELYKRYPQFKDFMADKLEWLYLRNNQPGKAFLLQHPLADLKVNPEDQFLKELLVMSERERPSRLERELMRTTSDNFRNDIIATQATFLMGNGELPAARETWNKMDASKWDEYGVSNPFLERINDCVHCPIRDTANLLSRPAIIDRLIKLEYDALANREEGAKFFYQLGLAYYNMSYFSYDWNVLDFFRSGSSLKRPRSKTDPDVVLDQRFSRNNREYFDCSKAMDYFERARLLAKEPELGASATFMAAKCEQNLFFAYGGVRTYRYFELLKTQYAGTRFYQKAINECKYFRYYASK